MEKFITGSDSSAIAFAILVLYVLAIAFIVKSKISLWFASEPRRTATRKSSALIFTALLLLVCFYWMTLLSLKINYSYKIPGVTIFFIVCALLMTFAMTIFIESFASNLRRLLGPTWVRWLEYPYVVLGLLGLYRVLSDTNDAARDPEGAFLAPVLLVTAASIKITKINIEVELSKYLRKGYRRLTTEARKIEREDAVAAQLNLEKWKTAETQEIPEQRRIVVREYARKFLSMDRDNKSQRKRLARLDNLLSFAALALCGAAGVASLNYIGIQGAIIAGITLITLLIAIRLFLWRDDRRKRKERSERFSRLFNEYTFSRAETLLLIMEYVRDKDNTLYISNFDALMRSRAEEVEQRAAVDREPQKS